MVVVCVEIRAKLRPTARQLNVKPVYKIVFLLCCVCFLHLIIKWAVICWSVDWEECRRANTEAFARHVKIRMQQQQHNQQQQLKHSLITLISDLKHKQRTVLHQQGMLF